MTKFSKTGKVNGFDVYELELKKTGIGNIHVECKAEELFRQTALDASCRQTSAHEEKYEVRLFSLTLYEYHNNLLMVRNLNNKMKSLATHHVHLYNRLLRKSEIKAHA